MDISSWCTRIIRTGFYLLFFLVPLLLTPWNYELFEFNKMVAVYGLTTIIVGAWIVKMISEKEIRITRTPLDIPIVLFVSSQFVSSLFSIDPHVSWFGYYSRFNGGMWSVISYVLLYYAFVNNMPKASEGQSIKASKLKNQNVDTLTHADTLTHLLHIILASGFLVAFYGVLERVGIDKHLWVQDVQSRVFSTLGQPNWLGAYLVVLIFIAIGFALKESRVRSQEYRVKSILSPSFLLYFVLCTLYFLTLLFTRSRSGLLAFAVADVVFWGLLLYADKTSKTRLHLVARSSYQPKTNSTILLPFFLLHFSFFLIVFFNGSYVSQIDKYFTLQGLSDRFTHKEIQSPAPVATPSGTLLEVGGTESGKIRKFVWQGAINAWRGSWKNFLIGTGTETYAFAFYQYRPAGHNLTSEWDFLYNKAHNEYLNYLATTGIFGLGSYFLLVGGFVVWFVRTQISNLNDQQGVKISKWSLSSGFWVLNIALFASWLSILVTNFFGFSVVVMQIFFFLIPAFLFTMTDDDHKRKEFIKQLSFPEPYRKIASIVFVGISLILIYRIFSYWQADTLFASGYRLSRAGAYEKAQSLFSQAIQRNHNEPMYHDELGTVLAGLSIQALDAQEATNGATRAKLALEESDKALLISPRNVNFWKSRTKIFYALSQFDPSFLDASIKALEQARTLSPNDPKIYYNLAVLEGQLTNYDKAVDYLLTAKALKPNYRDVYFALSVFYKEMKKPDLAKTVLQEYLTNVDPTDSEFLTQVK